MPQVYDVDTGRQIDLHGRTIAGLTKGEEPNRLDMSGVAADSVDLAFEVSFQAHKRAGESKQQVRNQRDVSTIDPPRIAMQA